MNKTIGNIIHSTVITILYNVIVYMLISQDDCVRRTAKVYMKQSNLHHTHISLHDNDNHTVYPDITQNRWGNNGKTICTATQLNERILLSMYATLQTSNKFTFQFSIPFCHTANLGKFSILLFLLLIRLATFFMASTASSTYAWSGWVVSVYFSNSYSKPQKKTDKLTCTGDNSSLQIQGAKIIQ